MPGHDNLTTGSLRGDGANDAPICMHCGVTMIRAGTTHVCPSCTRTKEQHDEDMRSEQSLLASPDADSDSDDTTDPDMLTTTFVVNIDGKSVSGTITTPPVDIKKLDNIVDRLVSDLCILADVPDTVDVDPEMPVSISFKVTSGDTVHMDDTYEGPAGGYRDP